MKGERCCENCANLHVSIVKVDFGCGGIEYEDCAEIDNMSDEDVELADAGECPKWKAIDYEELRAVEEAEYQAWLDSEKENR